MAAAESKFKVKRGAIQLNGLDQCASQETIDLSRDIDECGQSELLTMVAAGSHDSTRFKQSPDRTDDNHSPVIQRHNPVVVTAN